MKELKAGQTVMLNCNYGSFKKGDIATVEYMSKKSLVHDRQIVYIRNELGNKATGLFRKRLHVIERPDYFKKRRS